MRVVNSAHFVAVQSVLYCMICLCAFSAVGSRANEDEVMYAYPVYVLICMFSPLYFPERHFSYFGHAFMITTDQHLLTSCVAKTNLNSHQSKQKSDRHEDERTVQ